MDNQDTLNKITKLKYGEYIGAPNILGVLISNLDDLKMLLESNYIKNKILEITYIGIEPLPIELFENKKLKITVESPLVFTDDFCRHFAESKDIEIAITEDLYQGYTFAEISAINAIIKEIINAIPKDADDFEKVAFIYKTLADRISYDVDAIVKDEGNLRKGSKIVLARSLKGALIDGVAVCIGYSTVFSKILTEIGIENQTVSGSMEDITAEDADHAWNMVKIDGKWYHTDLSADVDNIRNKREPEFFLYQDATFSRTRRILYAEPTCLRKFLELNPDTPPSKIEQFLEPHVANESYNAKRVREFFEELYQSNSSKQLIQNITQMSKRVTTSSDLSIDFCTENNNEKGKN